MTDIDPRGKDYPAIVDDANVHPHDHPPTLENMRPGDTEYEVKDQYDRSILTVGALRAMLEGLPDGTHVSIATEAWYRNVHVVITPGCQECGGEWSAVTLFPGEELDPRQF